MKQKKLLFLLVGALVLLLALYFAATGIRASRERADAQRREESLSIFRLDGLRRVGYDTGEISLSFTKEESLWRCDAQPDWPLRQNDLATLENTLCNLRAERVIETPASLQAYRLDTPDCEITMTDLSGASHRLLLSLADNGSWYLAVEGDARVYLVSDGLREAADASLLELVDYETAPPLSSGDISLILLRYAGGEYRFTHAAPSETQADAQRLWTAERDGAPYAADSVNIDSAVYNLLHIQPVSCAAYDPTPEALAAYGFDDPLASIEVSYTGETGEPARYTLLIGRAQGEDAASYPVMLEGGRAVTLADAGNINDMFPLFTSRAAA